MSDKPDDPSANSLGLDLDSLKITDEQPPPAPSTTESLKQDSDAAENPTIPSASKELLEATESSPALKESPSEEKSPQSEGKQPGSKHKQRPYVNPDRVKTGGAQRDKLTEEELAERMVRIREQNEKIKLRREDVKKDEDEFRKMQETERIKQAKNKKVQEHVNRTREQNARRKMERIESREWDTGKQGGQWKDQKKSDGDVEGDATNRPPPPSIGIRGAMRGGGRGRGRGRGRGAGGDREEKISEIAPDTPTLDPAADAPAETNS